MVHIHPSDFQFIEKLGIWFMRFWFYSCLWHAQNRKIKSKSKHFTDSFSSVKGKFCIGINLELENGEFSYWEILLALDTSSILLPITSGFTILCKLWNNSLVHSLGRQSSWHLGKKIMNTYIYGAYLVLKRYNFWYIYFFVFGLSLEFAAYSLIYFT